MTDREAMKLALEALERSMEAGVTGIKVDQAIAALRQALEQPEREWQGLTDEEIQDFGYEAEKFDKSNSEWFDRFGFARAIEAKLKEKNHE